MRVDANKRLLVSTYLWTLLVAGNDRKNFISTSTNMSPVITLQELFPKRWLKQEDISVDIIPLVTKTVDANNKISALKPMLLLLLYLS